MEPIRHGEFRHVVRFDDDAHAEVIHPADRLLVQLADDILHVVPLRSAGELPSGTGAAVNRKEIESDCRAAGSLDNLALPRIPEPPSLLIGNACMIGSIMGSGAVTSRGIACPKRVAVGSLDRPGAI